MINFLKYKYIYFALSLLVIIPGVYSLARFGLKPAVDFSGGSVWEIKLNKVEIIQNDLIQFFADRQDPDFNQVVKTSTGSFSLKFKPLTQARHLELATALKEKFGEFTEVQFETVGPLLGRELLIKTITAVVLAAILIMLYIIYRFRDRVFGIAAILAMLHDTLVMLGTFSLLGHFLGIEVDILYVTAVLTILSFSTHDTVVVYDRIRELTKMFPEKPFTELINMALNETIVRSLNNSLTVIFMLVALLLLGGASIKNFALALLIGTISGTYSSLFTASPILAIWHDFIASKQKRSHGR